MSVKIKTNPFDAKMTNFKDKEDVKRLLGNRAGKSELTPMLNAIGTIIQLRKELADAQEYLSELKQFATEKVNEITELRNASIDCRICQHYCETNGCEADLCTKGDSFKKSETLHLWDILL